MKFEELNIKTSNICNYHCLKCFDRFNTSSYNSLDEEKTKNFIDFLIRNNNLKRVCLSGGEPLAYSPVWNLVDFAFQNDLNVVMQSNGSLIEKNRLELLKRINPNFKLAISLDTLIENDYRHFTGTKIPLEKIKTSIKKLVDNGFNRLFIMTIIGNYNINQLVDLYHFSQELGLEGITYQPISPFYFSVEDGEIIYHKERTGEYIKLKESELRKLETQLLKLKEIKESGDSIIQNSSKDFIRYIDYFFNPNSVIRECNNFNILMLTHEGDVKTCWSGTFSIGNIYVEDYAKILSNYENARRIMLSCEMPCILKCHNVKYE